MAGLIESDVEQAALDWLESLGWRCSTHCQPQCGLYLNRLKLR
jgi:hypothetical protein